MEIGEMIINTDNLLDKLLETQSFEEYLQLVEQFKKALSFIAIDADLESLKIVNNVYRRPVGIANKGKSIVKVYYPEEFQLFLRELKALRNNKGKGIFLEYEEYGIIVDRNANLYFAIVYEYLPNSNSLSIRSFEELVFVINNLLRKINELHVDGLVHGDLSNANVLVKRSIAGQPIDLILIDAEDCASISSIKNVNDEFTKLIQIILNMINAYRLNNSDHKAHLISAEKVKNLITSGDSITNTSKLVNYISSLTK